MNELIQVIEVLNENELKLINEYVDELAFINNTVFGPDGSRKIDTTVRSSLGSTMDESNSFTELLHKKINEALLTYKSKIIEINEMFQYYPVPGGFSTNCYREAIQVLEYQPTQEYKFHHDTSNDPNSKEYHRQISVVIYLNDEFIGGGTEFPHKTYNPAPGYGLFFPSNWCYPHSGQKVLSGKKRVAVTWYYVNENK